MTDLPRNQHIIASGLIAGVGIAIAWISFTQEPADAYIFPRLISSVFAVLAIWTFVKAVMGRTKVGNGLSPASLPQYGAGPYHRTDLCLLGRQGAWVLHRNDRRRVHPDFALRPAPHSKAATWIKRIAITAGFMAVMYALFALLLNVFTPREIFS